MICRHCARGGDLRQQLPPVRPGGDITASNRYNGLVRRINNAHRDCRGGSWCDCQHVDTPHQRRAPNAPVAQIAAPVIAPARRRTR